MDTQATVTAYQQDSRGRDRIEGLELGRGRAADRQCRENSIESPELVVDLAIVPANQETARDQPAGQRERHPSPVAKLLVDRYGENERAEREADQMHGDMLPPCRMLLALPQPEPTHRQLRERERQ